MAELSPAAQAVFDAWVYPARLDIEQVGIGARIGVAQAIRGAADQVAPEDPDEAMHFTTEAIRLNRMSIRRQLLAIAAELEGSNDPA